MVEIKCDRCGRNFEYMEDKLPGGVLISGDPNWEDECSHCHTCTYDDCHVFLNRPKWVCKKCIDEKTSQAR